MTTIISEEQLKRSYSLNMRQFMVNSSVGENDLSKLTEISQSAINRIKNGHVCPSLYQAVLIAEALGNTIGNFITEPKEVYRNYLPVINTIDLLKNKKASIIGFIDNTESWKNNVLGFKVDNTFNCKIVSNDSVIISSIEDDNKSFDTGDTVLFISDKKYMIVTIQSGFIKPIDNLSIKMNLLETSVIGKVLSIETKYIKDKSAVATILEKFNTNNIRGAIESITKSLALHPS